MRLESYQKFKQAVIVVGALAATVLMVIYLWRENWAGAGFFFGALAFFGAQLKQLRDIMCPNGKCAHTPEMHAMNLEGKWRCKFDGCRCGASLAV